MFVTPKHCLTDPDTQKTIKDFVRDAMPSTHLLPTDEETADMNRQVGALAALADRRSLYMIPLRRLYENFEAAVEDFLRKYANNPDHAGSKFVFITENIGRALNGTGTPKSAEWFLRWFLESLGGDDDSRIVVLDLSLMGENGGLHASDAIAALFEGAESVVFVVLNDCVYAGKQQPEQMKRLIDWITGALDARGRPSRNRVHIHIAVGCAMWAGYRIIVEMMEDKQIQRVISSMTIFARVMCVLVPKTTILGRVMSLIAPVDETAPPCTLHLLALQEVKTPFGKVKRVPMNPDPERMTVTDATPGQVFAQMKVPDTIAADLVGPLKEILGKYNELYRSPDVLALIDAFVLGRIVAPIVAR